MIKRILILICFSTLFLSACGASESPETDSPDTQANTAAQKVLAPTSQPLTAQASPSATQLPTATAQAVTVVLPTASVQIAPSIAQQPTQAPGPASQQTAPPTTQPQPGSPTAAVQPGATIGRPSGNVPAPVLVPSSAVPESATLPSALLEPLRADLASRTGVDPASITVVQSEAMQWADGSLGCPKPGVEYTMEPQAGFRVILSAAGQSYDYRVTWKKHYMLCQQ